MAALAEKYTRKPFNEGPKPRMTQQEFDAALQWVDAHFSWILPSSEDDWTVEKILSAAGQLCLRRGIRGPGWSETEYVSHCLKRIRVFARQRGVHVWIVVHPAKLYRNDNGKYPVPTLYDCAGSAHWRNKADNGIVVWRDLSEADSPEINIHVQKIRFRHIGRRGRATLYYEPVCATYRDHEAPQEQREWFP